MKLYIIFINRIIYRSYSCTFSRHGRVEASFTLLIWLNENVPLLLAASSPLGGIEGGFKGCFGGFFGVFWGLLGAFLG